MMLATRRFRPKYQSTWIMDVVHHTEPPDILKPKRDPAPGAPIDARLEWIPSKYYDSGLAQATEILRAIPSHLVRLLNLCTSRREITVSLFAGRMGDGGMMVDLRLCLEYSVCGEGDEIGGNTGGC